MLTEDLPPCGSAKLGAWVRRNRRVWRCPILRWSCWSGASGSGKSAWAAQRYRPDEVVSSDRLRALVGSGEHDLDASADAFALLDQIVAARLRRGLTAVVDTLGLDPARRRGYLALARSSGMPAVAVACRHRSAGVPPP